MGETKTTTSNGAQRIHDSSRISVGRGEKHVMTLILEIEFQVPKVALEKRVGIAQLCLLLLVLIFMALTRGSRGKPPLIRHDGAANTKSSKDQYWGRHLNLSTNWSRHLKSSSSTEGDVSTLSNQPQIPSHSSHMHTGELTR